MFLSAVSIGFSLVLDPRGRLGGLGGKGGSACEVAEYNEGGILDQCFREFWYELIRVVIDKESLNDYRFCVFA